MDSHGNAEKYGESLDLTLFVYCWAVSTFTKDAHGVSQAEYNWMQTGVADDKGITAKPCNVLAECLLPWSIKDSLAGRKQAKKKSATTLAEERKCMSGAPPERASDERYATAPKGESQPPCCGCIQEKPPREKPSVSIATMVRQIAAAVQPVEAAAVLFLLYASYDTKPEMVLQAACGMAVGIAAALDLHAQKNETLPYALRDGCRRTIIPPRCRRLYHVNCIRNRGLGVSDLRAKSTALSCMRA
jgi:hypothetical protein